MDARRTDICCAAPHASRKLRGEHYLPTIGTVERKAAMGIVASESRPGFCGLYWPGAGDENRHLDPASPRCVLERKLEDSPCMQAGPPRVSAPSKERAML